MAEQAATKGLLLLSSAVGQAPRPTNIGFSLEDDCIVLEGIFAEAMHLGG